MSGIYFFGTNKLQELRRFYVDEVGCELWLEQADCVVCRHGNLLFGFCQRQQAETEGILCFFYQRQQEVDTMYDRLRSIAVDPPRLNDKYQIYHFFATDPEDRKIEFQHFGHHIAEYLCGEELLLCRRSVREFTSDPVPHELLNRILDNCRFAPTSVNSQSYYFKVIEDRKLLERIAGTRKRSSAPIAKAPLAVAICADPSLSRRHIQDGCIAAYHFTLAAWQFGLGTCWIAAMDRNDIKDWLKIPADHYVATITPLGFPEKQFIEAPERKQLDWFVRE